MVLGLMLLVALVSSAGGEDVSRARDEGLGFGV
jgi:hypothetical protein